MIETYCPDIRTINDPKTHYSFLDDEERDILIAAALRREIIKRGDVRKFVVFLQQRGYATIHPPFISAGKERYLIDWDVIDPSTLIRVAGEWVASKE